MRNPSAVILPILLFTLGASAQQYNISTLAGGVPIPTPALATSDPLGIPGPVATDAAGNVYFFTNNCLFKIDLTGNMTRVAGTSRPGFSGEGAAPANAQLQSPGGVAIDSSNNIYIADSGNNRIRKIAGGTITTIAGGSTAGYYGDGLAATSALLNSPQGLALDSAGNLYIADSGNNVVRKITFSNGTMSTVAGTGVRGNLGDGSLALNAQLNAPIGVALDTSNNIYISDTGNNRVRFVNIATSVISAFAGNGTAGYNGDLIGPLNAQLNGPTYLVVDSAFSVYINDTKNGRIRKVPLNGFIQSVAGGNSGLPPVGTPSGIALDSSNSLYVADSQLSRILKVQQNQVFNVVAGNGARFYLGQDGGPAAASQLSQPQGLAMDSSNNLYIADAGLGLVRKISASGLISSVATGATAPSAIAIDASGNLYIADTAGNRVIKLNLSGAITIAGTGTAGFSPDGTRAASALLSQPTGVAVDTAGNVYISDTGNNVVRMVNLSGTIFTVATSNGVQLSQPSGLAFDATGILYIADTGNNRVRKLTPGGAITTFAGTGAAGSSGDAGQAVNAAISAPHGVAVDATGNVYITDTAGRIRKVSTAGIITTIAGTGVPGYSGDGAAAINAQFLYPWGVALDSQGNVYVSDYQGAALRLMTFVKTAPVTINSSTTLISGTVGSPYAQVLSATGGVPPYSWSVTAGSLPAGLSLSATGTLSGTPSVAQTYLFAVVATDSASVASAPVTFTMSVLANNPSGLTITTPPTLISGALGIPYSQVLSATGGVAPYTWSLASGAIPAGLSISSSGIISGTPGAAGTAAFTVRVTDSAFATTTAGLTLTVVSTPLTHTGTFGHIAVGGIWDTKVYLTNVTSAPVALNLSLLDNNGAALTLPLTITQEGSTQTMSTQLYSGVIDPNTTLVLDAGPGVQNLVTGWIQILSSDVLAGYAVFQTAANGTGSAGTAPLQTTFESKIDLPFDNTGGYETDFALANLANAATTINVSVLDAAGINRWTYVLTLPANGHAAFSVASQFPATAGRQGLVQFQSSAGNLAGVGLRANTSTGSFTSVPLILP